MGEIARSNLVLVDKVFEKCGRMNGRLGVGC